jgi:lysyl-tRNA synthetase, class II
MSESTATPVPDEGQILAERRTKLKVWRKKGGAFPNSFFRSNLAGDLHFKYEDSGRDHLDLNPVVVKIAGRLMLKRPMGKATVGAVQDMSGYIILYLTDYYPGSAQHIEFKEYDIGDIIGIEGVLFKSQAQELMVRVKRVILLTKALRPIPVRQAEPNVQELPRRERIVELITNEDMRLRFVLRSRIIQAMRAFFVKRKYLEVETPFLNRLTATTQPNLFLTHHNATGMEVRLCGARDLYLNRLLVGGLEQVFEINRDFRNDSRPSPHNPEFTTFTFCTAYRNHYYVMQVIEKLIREVTRTTLGTSKICTPTRDIDFDQPYGLHTIGSAILQYFPDIDEESIFNRDVLIAKLKAHSATFRIQDGIGALQFELFRKTIISQLADPTFVFHFPVEFTPFARRSEKDSNYTEYFSLYLGGIEIASGFSTLNDSEDQAMRFWEELSSTEDTQGMETAPWDSDYVRALEHGLPPAATATIAVDRLVMFLTDTPTPRETILFPHPEARRVPANG